MKKVLKITAVTTLLSLGLAFSSYAGQWKQGTGANAGKWWYDEDNGTYATNGWRWIDGDGDGIAENYCFDQSGWLYVSTETPDKKTGWKSCYDECKFRGYDLYCGWNRDTGT